MINNFFVIGINASGDRLHFTLEMPERGLKIFETAMKVSKENFDKAGFKVVKLVVIEGHHVHDYNENETLELLA